MDSTAAIFERLQTIWPRLDEYQGQAAVFSDRAPDDFQFGDLPVVVIAAATSDTDASTFTEVIREIAQDVRLYARDTGSTGDLDQLARDVRDLFHLQPTTLTVDGGKCTIATATGPVSSPTTDPSLVGRRITLRLQLQKD